MDDETTPADSQVQQAIRKEGLRMEATLPSGRVIVMRELTGKEEMAAAAEAGDIGTPRGRQLLGWAQTMRSLVSIDGKPFDTSDHTAETFRDLFGAKEYQHVMELFMMLNRPTEEEAAAFRKSARLTA